MKDFILQIKKNLELNGFPEKKVSLPTEKMYELADNKGLSLNKALEFLKETDNIDYEVGSEKIIFSLKPIDSNQNFNMDGITPDMMKKAQEMMGKMDPAELERMKNQILNMSDEEREKMLEEAKKMGML